MLQRRKDLKEKCEEISEVIRKGTWRRALEKALHYLKVTFMQLLGPNSVQIEADTFCCRKAASCLDYIDFPEYKIFKKVGIP